MAVTLLDVNALLALIWPEHQFHAQMTSWFRQHAQQGWATCPITQMGFVRIVSSGSFTKNAPSIGEAFLLLQLNIAHAHHEFWADDVTVPQSIEQLGIALQGHRQITDACLLGLAMRRKGKLATFDRSVAALLPDGKRKSDWIVELST
jgi:uncharacterized protein